MAGDKSKDLYRLPLNFSSGEQPTGAKLTALSVQSDSAFNKLELMVGDLWGLNRPYTLITSKQGALSEAWAKKGYGTRSAYNANETVTGVPYRDLQIANLARLIGPASALNPRILPGLQVAESVFINEGTGETVESGTYVTRLRYRPYTSSEDMAGFSGTFSEISGSTVFTTEVATPEQVNGYGDYHVSAEGIIYTGGKIRSSTSVTYTYITGDGDTYPGASFNVIPDPNQNATALTTSLDTDKATQKACSVAWDSATGRLEVTLPVATHAQLNYQENAISLEGGTDPNFEVQLTLPSFLNGMNANDIIPEGFVYLYDNKTRTIVQGATYYYSTQSVLYVDGVDSLAQELGDASSTLESGDTNTWRWSLITVGVNITQLLDYLRNRMLKHAHTGADGSAAISHSDLSGLFGTRDLNLEQVKVYRGYTPTVPTHGGLQYYIRAFNKSDMPGNDHPQYLHRLGYGGGGTDGSYANRDLSTMNRANVMMGDFVLGPVGNGADDGYTWENDSPLNGDSDSHSIWFGNVPGSAGIAAGGAVRAFHNAVIITTGSMGLETTSAGLTLDEGSGHNVFDGKGLHFQRGNVYVGFSGNENDPISPVAQETSFAAGVSQFTVIATANDRASVNSGDADDTDGFKRGIRFKAAYGSSVHLGVRGGGVNPKTGTYSTSDSVDSFARTGVAVIEASTSDVGMNAIDRHGADTAWPGDNTHGAAIIVSPGGGPTIGDSSLLNSGNEGYCRWTDDAGGGDTFGIGNNQGGFVHIVAGSDYTKIKSITWLTGGGAGDEYVETFQTHQTQVGSRPSPWGRVAIDSDRGIDLVVRTQKYLHEENYTSVGSALGQTNFGGGKVAAADGSVNVSSQGNLAEVRFTTDTDYYNFDTTGYQQGSNANFFYKYGQQYNRHNVTYTDDNLGTPDLNTTETTIDRPTWGWRGGRDYSLFGIGGSDYGSNILGAGLVEAFRGLRSDPNQPPVHTYVFPFEYTVQGVGVVGRDIAGVDHWFGFPLEIHPYGDTSGHSIRYPANKDSTLSLWTQTTGQAETLTWPVDDDNVPITWDQVIKWHDNRLHEVIGSTNGTGGAMSSVLGMQLNLLGWWYDTTGAATDYLMDATGQNHTPYLSGLFSSATVDRSVWIPPCSGLSPYRPFNSTEQASNYHTEASSYTLGTGLRANARKLFKDQNLTTKWYSWSMDISDTILSASHTTLKTTANMGKILDAYQQYPLVLNLEFGSNPFNVKGVTGQPYSLPYFADQPSWTDGGNDTNLQATFNLVLYGRLIVTLAGDSPYAYIGTLDTFSTV